MAERDESRPIIRKRKTVVSGGAHHGGAWKVAYADFVTAMMAFFLLMWLLNATTEEQRKGLADYFNPSVSISRTSAGGSGLLAGESIFVTTKLAGSAEQGARPKPTHREPGKMAGAEDASPEDSKIGEFPAHAGPGAVNPEHGEEVATTARTFPVDDDAPTGEAQDDKPQPGDDDGTVTDPETARELAAAQAERARLEDIRRKIAEAMRNADDGSLERHFVLHITPEGLVIEIVDADDRPLFASASTRPEPTLEVLAEVLVPVLGETLNDIAVVGHTDAVPFGGEGYSNWELSADRANAARRLLLRQGLPADRIVRISGKAAVEPLVGNPMAPQNRRIALILLRETAH